MLEVQHLTAHYGQAQALRDVSFEVKEGELITLVGRNGAGKSTTLRCVMGLHQQMSGPVRLGGRDLTGLAAHEDRAKRARARLRQLSARSQGQLGKKTWTREDLHDR